MRLLLTRPEPEASASAARLRALGHEVVVAPVLEIAPLAVRWPLERFDALIATSAHAFPAQIPALDLPVFTVGDQTAAAARRWTPAAHVTTARDAKTLLALLYKLPPAHYLYLAGQDRKPHLETGLAATPHKVTTLETYVALAAKTLPEQARAALAAGRLDGALHYSRRSAGIFLQLAAVAALSDHAARLVHFCLSDDVAVPLREAGAADVRMASHPDEAAMFRLLRQ